MRDAGTCSKRKPAGGLGESKRRKICAPMTNHPIVRLLPRQDRRLRAGHPWAFSNEIAMAPKHCEWPRACRFGLKAPRAGEMAPSQLCCMDLRVAPRSGPT